MSSEEANRLVEGDRVKTRGLTGVVVGATTNCVSIQWDGRATPEIYTPDDMRNIRKAGEKKGQWGRHAAMSGSALTAVQKCEQNGSERETLHDRPIRSGYPMAPERSAGPRYLFQFGEDRKVHSDRHLGSP
jgi:hypothetical protein